MSKHVLLLLAVAVALSFGSCRRAAERAAQKIHIDAVERIERKGLTGAEAVLRITNGTGYKLELQRADFTLYYAGRRVGTIRLHEGIEVGKRTVESVVTRWKVAVDDPIALLLTGRALQADDPSQLSVSCIVEGRGGPARINIDREKMPLSDFLNIFGITLQDVKKYLF
ncbi:MAG: hypothetical protein NC250_03425 [Alistipes senegalensis]|nr:hypothetical protein [Bacteroides cellulosilyticus]MCM1351767.1 hypothetical protein [Alistipes senegalensis]